ncbi:MAG: uroporphyrinogen decarboxylase family protein [Candidatus Bathyarchaeia archaeon]
MFRQSDGYMDLKTRISIERKGKGKRKAIYTSTIGSFPLEDSPENRIRCLKDLLRLGVDLPNYPQLMDMGEQFLEDMASEETGIVKRGSTFWLVGKEIEKPERPPGVEPFLWAKDYLEKEGIRPNLGLKACLTGPFTLASYIKVSESPSPFGTALIKEDLVWGLTEALQKTFKVFSQGAQAISIDEPILSSIVGRRILFGYKADTVTEVLDTLVKVSPNIFTGVHICGRISPLLVESLLATKLDFLSHEFTSCPENFEVYSPEKLAERDKVLAIGCVSTQRAIVENVEEIKAFVINCLRYGSVLIFTPDCGFRNLMPEGSRLKGYSVAMAKVGNMVQAIWEVKSLLEENGK